MESFCTKANHDNGVPSKHNYHCNGQSVMEVIEAHPDFGFVKFKLFEISSADHLKLLDTKK